MDKIGGKPERELRIGLVLYGGVSLCMYIYGVACEFLRLVRREGDYAKLADECGVTPVIDVISGASAGGINGLFLAKALATNADLKPLREMWVVEGDIGKLIDTRRGEPLSLLDSEGYLAKLEKGLKGLIARPAAGGGPVQVLDLFLTATDLDGVQTQTRDLLGTLVTLKDHASVFHFRVRPEVYPFGADSRHRGLRGDAIADRVFARIPPRNDFAPVAAAAEAAALRAAPPADKDRLPAKAAPAVDKDHLLAKVAAATSAFPLAFAPVRFSAAEKQAMRSAFDQDLFAHGAERDSVFGDGGMLDNKPFGYTTATIFNRHADRIVERKLFYVEPDPEVFTAAHRLADRSEGADGLDSLQATLTAGLYQSIAGDIARIQEQNAKMKEMRARLDELEKQLAQTIETLGVFEDDHKETPNWQEFAAELRKALESSPVYPSYLEIKLKVLYAGLLDRLLAPSVDSDQRRVIQEHLLPGGDGKIAFLSQFDHPFRERRIRYFIDLINHWLEGPGREFAAQLGAYKGELYAHLEFYRRSVWEIWKDVRPATNPDEAKANFDIVGKRYKQMMEAPIRDTTLTLVQQIGGWAAERKLCKFWALKARFLAYEYFDLYTYPAIVLSGIGEASHIDFVRVSPDAATRYKRGPEAVREKLAGEQFMHFSAFFKMGWRENDIIWGRLDAAEIIVRTLFAGLADTTAREAAIKRYLDKLCPAIIQEEMSAIRERRRTMIDQALLGDSDSDRETLRQVLAERGGMDAQASEKYFAENYRLGQEGMGDLGFGQLLKLAATAGRTLTRVLKRLPQKLPEFMRNAVRTPIVTLNTVSAIAYFLIVTVRGYRNPLLVLAVALLLVIAFLLYHWRPA